MNTNPPNVASFRPPPSSIPPNQQNSVSTHPNFNSSHQHVRPLGPPNVQTMNASQPPFIQGPGIQRPQLGGPPSNASSNYSTLNGQGMRPQMPTAGIGNIQIFCSLKFDPILSI